ncbi:hypothetical protein JMUB7547_28490 [Staphylococcus aureus]
MYKRQVVKRGEYKENPQSGKVQLVYNEHVELVEVPIKPSDCLLYTSPSPRD